MINNKNNKGFILIMTLVMALVMLIICFVCLKIFLAPYVAIQNDIIKKKEFYMADTAIEIIREQISDIFYNYLPSEEGKHWENIEDKYYIENLQIKFAADKLTEKLNPSTNNNTTTGENESGELGNEHSSDIDDVLRDSQYDRDFIAKYNGDLFNTGNTFKNTLPLSVSISSTNPNRQFKLNTSNISVWENSAWEKWVDKPLRGLDHQNDINNFLDANISVEAHIEPVLINDINLVATYTTNNLITSSNTDSHHFTFKEPIPEGTAYFLPKELQKQTSIDINVNSNDEENKFIKEHLTRRDYVIIATSSYSAGTNAKCVMKYYFSLVSLSPKKGDHLTFWGSGVYDTEHLEISAIKPMYRLYFRKLEYNWIEED